MNVSRRKLGLVASVATLAAAVVSGGGAVAQASSASAGHIKPFAGVFNPIQNVGNSMCLQPVNPVVNSPVVQEPCDGSAMQGWQYISDSHGGYDFLNQASGACLNAFITAENGAPFGLSSCRSVSNELFNTASLPNVTSVESKIGWRNTGYCMDVPGASKQAGLQIQLWGCNGTLAQRWVIGFA
ncbi:putative periplasmic ligand-binding sensor protein [Catenulispora acidiphila DSM 44928]|uniref:Putative periplasmic ligand-binding sensor protein n=1 Tax=Catenulispora acidiphila (strain DSM 44928 / JCM 14897 / NBRC 102108 / NRRL B-24433 / ID139908) TaxID=479433 RepID=C7Q1E6_CATAD|nr:RICIN domain-containing protein [Catenulispora acidiphila]ACU73675.1 putative periplasmic ligand-binding sensor protein [Catenulispora acidiphila DSM 44928]